MLKISVDELSNCPLYMRILAQHSQGEVRQSRHEQLYRRVQMALAMADVIRATRQSARMAPMIVPISSSLERGWA